MDAIDLAECLKLLDAADKLLLEGDEIVLAARLAAVVDPLRARAAALRVDGHDGSARVDGVAPGR